MMKIYHFLLDHRINGHHIYVKSFIGKLSSKTSQIIITPGKGPFTDIRLICIRHFWKPLYLIEIFLNVLLILFFSLFKKIERKQTVFCVHGAANIAPIIAARILHVPVVWYFHEAVEAYKLIVNTGLKFLSPGRYQLVAVIDKVAEVYGLVNYVVLHASVDLAFWDTNNISDQQKKEIKKTHDTFNILCVGNLNPLKGHDILLDALGEFNSEGELFLIGSALTTQKKYFNLLQEKSKKINKKLPNLHIRFLGYKNQEEIRSYLMNCDVFVLPSRSEACPTVLLEAMAMRCVCVATSVGGVPKIISSSSMGITIPASDPVALRYAIEKVYAISKKERLAIGNLARARIENDFSSQQIAMQHLKIYQSLVG
ncbi:MAG: glycosyltransferase family 4 protein [bacterium]